MNERAFTPGPWFVSEPNNPERTGLLIKPIPGDVVAEIDVLSNAIANARLIAAAPELYGALDQLRTVMACHDGTPEEFLALANAAAALAKAAP